jgi:hypothetical protein
MQSSQVPANRHEAGGGLPRHVGAQADRLQLDELAQHVVRDVAQLEVAAPVAALAQKTLRDRVQAEQRRGAIAEGVQDLVGEGVKGAARGIHVFLVDLVRDQGQRMPAL